MALLEYFKRENAQYAGCKLPDPQGALAKEVPPWPYSAVWQIRKNISTKFSKTVIRENLDL